MTNPAISIIIPAYNCEKKIDRCLQSIMHQSFADFEVIIIDDGSKDATATICREYCERDSRFKLVRQSNKGVSTARNTGLDNAKGIYIVFADSDDEANSDWLESFISESSDSVDLIVHGLTIFFSKEYIKNKGGDHERKVFDVKTGVEFLYEIQLNGYLFNKLFRRDIIKKNQIRFDTTLKFREDEVFFLHYAEAIKYIKYAGGYHYIYYCPPPDKNYGKFRNEFIWESMRSLNKIYSGEIPEKILMSQASAIKDSIVEHLLYNRRLTEEMICFYSNIYCKTFPERSSISQKFLNSVIINTLKLGPIPNILIKLIHFIKKR